MPSAAPLIVRAAWPALFLLACGCKGLGDLARPPAAQDPSKRGLVAPAPAPAPAAQDPLATIARFEDARSDGGGLLQSLLYQGEPRTRERAAVALGRLPFPENGATVTDALVRALEDESASVRAAAAFGMGLRADPASASALVDRADDPDAAVRARVVEALSRIDSTAARAAVLNAMRDADLDVRIEAAAGPMRWKNDAPDAAEIDAQLIELAAPASTSEVPLARAALFSLARRKSAAARAVFASALRTGDVESRIFAAQGLAACELDPPSREALTRAVADADWRVVVEALRALGAHPDAGTREVLENAARHASPHVRRVAYEVWGGLGELSRDPRSLSSRAMTDESLGVRNAAFVADVRLQGDGARAAVELRLGDSHPLVRQAAAQAAAHLAPESALALLLQLAQDADVRVVETACESLGTLEASAAHEKLVQLLASADNGVRLAALEALTPRAGPADVEAIARCFDTSRGEIGDEVAFNAVDAAVKVASARASADSVDETVREQVRGLLARALVHPDAHVRRRARAGHAQLFPGTEPPRAARPRDERAPFVPLPGIDYSRDDRPRVEVVTNRGTLLLELFTDETPVHVYSFLELVKRHFYDGTTFHRVVPDFVVQGGDRRADGNGGAAWRGDGLRAELTPRKFVRGSLGMPRNDDVDSGGSQLFLCHRATPHLDGRYTNFGALVGGFDVLDRLEVGDTIVTVRLARDLRR